MSVKTYTQKLKKLTVRALPFDKYGGKFWVKVLIGTTEWVPSFEELFWIVKYISFCEEEKYPTAHGYQGWRMVESFFKDACRPGAKWKDLKRKYKLPTRE